MKINAGEIRVGMLLEYKNDLWEVLKTQHVKPGKGGAFAQVEMKSVNKSTKLNERFRSNETVEKASLEEVKYNFLYEDDDNCFFMEPKSFEQLSIKRNKIGVLNLMGNVFMKKCDDVFETSKKFIDEHQLKKDYDILVVDFHGEITSEKNAMGHFFDGKATLVVGTHTHVPTNDARILKNGTAYQTDAGMCGDYDSVIGMDKENSLNRFMKKDSVKHFPSNGEASLSGVIVECNLKTGLAYKVNSYIFGGQLTNNK